MEPRNRNRLIIGGVLAAIVLIIAVVLVTICYHGATASRSGYNVRADAVEPQ
jgi:hypothetical protein